MFKEKEVDAAKREICEQEGLKSDHLLWVRAFTVYEDLERKSRGYADSWARRHFLNVGSMKLINRMRGQFAGLLQDAGFLSSSNYADFRSNVNSKNDNVITAIVCAGLYPRVGILMPRVRLRLFAKFAGHM